MSPKEVAAELCVRHAELEQPPIRLRGSLLDLCSQREARALHAPGLACRHLAAESSLLVRGELSAAILDSHTGPEQARVGASSNVQHVEIRLNEESGPEARAQPDVPVLDTLAAPGGVRPSSRPEGGERRSAGERRLEAAANGFRRRIPDDADLAVIAVTAAQGPAERAIPNAAFAISRPVTRRFEPQRTVQRRAHAPREIRLVRHGQPAGRAH